MALGYGRVGAKKEVVGSDVSPYSFAESILFPVLAADKCLNFRGQAIVSQGGEPTYLE